MNVTYALLAGVGGFVGSILRYLVGVLALRFAAGGFPLGTLLVNVIGCLAIGCIGGLAANRGISEAMRVFLCVGILGGFTTFSAFGFETFELFRKSQSLLAVSNVAANLLIGLAAVGLGWFIARSFFS